jgi:chromosome segregation ATPase
MSDLNSYEESLAIDLAKAVAAIKAMTEQLEAARADDKEAEAYAEELEKERDDLQLKLAGAVAECERIGGLWHTAEDKLAKAVAALRVSLEGLNWAKAYLSTGGIDSLPVNNADATVYTVLAGLEGKKCE